MKYLKSLVLAVCAALLFVASKPAGYGVGDTAADFKLKNIDGKMVSLADFKNAMGAIVIFDCNTCPYSKAGDTLLTMKQLTPVRLMKNRFFEQVAEAERRGVSNAEMESLLGKRRAKVGMFEGDLDDGELEIGQVAAGITKIQTAAEILQEVWNEYVALKEQLKRA